MFSLILKYILFIQCVFVSFIKITDSVKTYQVRRINESSYVVTSFPDLEYDSYNKILKQPSKDGVVSLTDNMTTTTENYNTITTVTVGEKKDLHKFKNKVSSSMINKARENYFKNFYATLKKPINTNISLLPQKMTPYSNFNLMGTTKSSYFQRNLNVARKLALMLISEAKGDNNPLNAPSDKTIVTNDKVSARKTKSRLRKRRRYW